jgi:1,4-dihydroxy-6-naphthoate synthase
VSIGNNIQVHLYHLVVLLLDQTLKLDVQKKINKLIKKSLEYAFNNYPHLPEYVKLHAQEMNEDVMRKHIELYVNDFSMDLGDTGKNAIETMYKMYLLQNKLPYQDADLFV